MRSDWKNKVVLIYVPLTGIIAAATGGYFQTNNGWIGFYNRVTPEVVFVAIYILIFFSWVLNSGAFLFSASKNRSLQELSADFRQCCWVTVHGIVLILIERSFSVSLLTIGQYLKSASAVAPNVLDTLQSSALDLYVSMLFEATYIFVSVIAWLNLFREKANAERILGCPIAFKQILRGDAVDSEHGNHENPAPIDTDINSDDKVNDSCFGAFMRTRGDLAPATNEPFTVDDISIWVGSLPRNRKALVAIANSPLTAPQLQKLKSEFAVNGKMLVYLKSASIESCGQSSGTRCRYKPLLTYLLTGVNLIEYEAMLLRKLNEHKLPGMYDIADYFVEPFFRNNDIKFGSTREPAFRLLQSLTINVREENVSPIVILGDYGMGKTTLMETWALQRVRDLQNGSGDHFPVFIPLKGKSLARRSPYEIIGAWASEHDLNSFAILAMLRYGLATLILEGFDEVPVATSEEERRLNFQAILRLFSEIRCRVIITGRPNTFYNYMELSRVLSWPRSEGGLLESHNIYRICDFSREEVLGALRIMKPDDKNRFMALLEHPVVADLFRRPMLLALSMSKWIQLEGNIDFLTGSSTASYFIDRVYEKRAGLAQRHGESSLLKDELELFMMAIAAWMFGTGSQNRIKDADLLSLTLAIIPYVSNVLSYQNRTRTLSDRMVEWGDEDDAQARVASEVRQCGTLVDGAVGEKAFGHRAFYEVLVAKCYLKWISRKDPKFCHLIRMECSFEEGRLLNEFGSLRCIAEDFVWPGGASEFCKPVSLKSGFSALLKAQLGGGRRVIIKKLILLNSSSFGLLSPRSDQKSAIANGVSLINAVFVLSLCTVLFAFRSIQDIGIFDFLILGGFGYAFLGTLVHVEDRAHKRLLEWSAMCEAFGMTDEDIISAFGISTWGHRLLHDRFVRMGVLRYRRSIRIIDA